MELKTEPETSVRELDPHLPLRQLDDLAARLQGDRRRKVETFRSHMYSEMVTLDMDALMATLTPTPRFRFNGLPGVPDLEGYDAVRGYYERSRASRRAGLTVALSGVVVDEEELVMRGEVWCSAAFATAAW